MALSLLQTRHNITNVPFHEPNFQGWTSSPSGRGSLDIIWSCLSTLTLVSWSSLCVNVPETSQTCFQRIGRKAWLTFVCLLGPEYILISALGQYTAARETLRAFKKHGWTPWSLRHSFCAEMRFWVGETKDGSRFPLNGKALVFLVEEGHISADDVTEKVLVDVRFINDRNKADTLL